MTQCIARWRPFSHNCSCVARHYHSFNGNRTRELIRGQPRLLNENVKTLSATLSTKSRARLRPGLQLDPPQLTRMQWNNQMQIRHFTSSLKRTHGDLVPPRPGEERHVTFIDKEGREHTFEVADGSNLLDIAQAHDLEMEGACGGSCACSTCHVIVQSDEYYDKLEEPSDDENDMLDLAFGLTETSRLGCQVQMSKELDGLVVKLPSMTRNMQASDFAEKKQDSV